MIPAAARRSRTQPEEHARWREWDNSHCFIPSCLSIHMRICTRNLFIVPGPDSHSKKGSTLLAANRDLPERMGLFVLVVGLFVLLLILLACLLELLLLAAARVRVLGLGQGLLVVFARRPHRLAVAVVHRLAVRVVRGYA